MIDNLTEAIAHYKERARNYIETLKPFGDKPMLEATKKYIARQQEFARKYEQLAAWLAELQERREADRWIPVTERTPDEDVDVIVSDMETYETYSAYYVGDGYWACDNGTYKHRITHWKPFPKKCDESGETIGEKFLSGWRNKSEDK